jgi:hypothetical protein
MSATTKTSSHYPVLYLEETDRDQIDWRVFVRFDRQSGNYIMYGTRRPLWHNLQSPFPFYRMVFTNVKSLAKWLKLNMNMDESSISLTIYNFELDALISDDFVGLNNLRNCYLETLGIDEVTPYLKSYASLVGSLKMLRDIQ